MSTKITQISPFHKLQYKRGKPLITDIRTGELIFYVGKEPIVFVKELLIKYLTEERKNLSIEDPIFHKLEGWKMVITDGILINIFLLIMMELVGIARLFIELQPTRTQ